MRPNYSTSGQWVRSGQTMQQGTVLGEPKCLDCIAENITTVRPTPRGGPRSPLCETHYRARKKKKSARAHAQHVAKTYGLSEEDYWGLYNFQKALVAELGGTGVDPIDLTSAGASKRLSVDHDHASGKVRGLLSSRSNFDLLGKFDAAALRRALDYLENPPADRFFDEPRYVPDEDTE